MRPVYDCAYCLQPVEDDDRRFCDACQATEDANDAALMARLHVGQAPVADDMERRHRERHRTEVLGFPAQPMAELVEEDPERVYGGRR